MNSSFCGFQRHNNQIQDENFSNFFAPNNLNAAPAFPTHSIPYRFTRQRPKEVQRKNLLCHPYKSGDTTSFGIQSSSFRLPSINEIIANPPPPLNETELQDCSPNLFHLPQAITWCTIKWESSIYPAPQHKHVEKVRHSPTQIRNMRFKQNLDKGQLQNSVPFESEMVAYETVILENHSKADCKIHKKKRMIPKIGCQSAKLHKMCSLCGRLILNSATIRKKNPIPERAVFCKCSKKIVKQNYMNPRSGQKHKS